MLYLERKGCIMSDHFLPLSEQKQFLEESIANAERSLLDKPPGTLNIQPKHSMIQFFHRLDSITPRVYLPRKEEALIKALAQKDYDQKFLKAAYNVKEQLDALSALHGARSASYLFQPLAAVYNSLSETRKQLVSPYVLPDDLFIQQWLSVPYAGLGFSPQDPEIMTDRGERVRSKSEKIIADKLFSLGIPYRYEFPVSIKGLGMVYADFTILDIRERRELIIEHFGMMLDAEYSTRTYRKIDHYQNAGYTLDDDLLISFESERYVFQAKTFEAKIRDRLMPEGDFSIRN